MHRFFTDEPILDGRVKILGDDFKHIKKVLRIAENEEIEVVVNGKLYNGLVEVGSDDVTVYNLRVVFDNTESEINIHLLQCIVKGDKLDYIIQKSVELGVKDITLVKSSRCIVKIDEKKEKGKFERYGKISYEASKQSKRLIIPEIKGILKISDCANFIDDKSVLLVAYENDRDVSLKNVIRNLKSREVKDIYVLIGPEGGFDIEEVKFLVEKGAISIGLGPRILRTETAGISLISILQYEFI